MLTEQQFVLRLDALDADALAHYRAADTADERAAWLQISNAIGEGKASDRYGYATARRARMLMSPRYVLREMPTEQRRARLTFGVFDSFTQEFVGGPNSRAQAERNARAANRAYEAGQCIFAEDGE